MLQITAAFLIACLKRRKLLNKLLDLSYKDALTKLGNRFALSNYLEQLDREQSIAVVYCDITGLKRINDNVGHVAGDELIIKCSRCLEQVYSDYGVFRIGGDELLAVCPNTDQAAAEERFALLRATMKEAWSGRKRQRIICTPPCRRRNSGCTRIKRNTIKQAGSSAEDADPPNNFSKVKPTGPAGGFPYTKNQESARKLLVLSWFLPVLK